MCSLENPIKSSAMEGIQGSLVILLCYKLSQHEFFPFSFFLKVQFREAFGRERIYTHSEIYSLVRNKNIAGGWK